jgi:hypothetical protein
MTRPLTVTSPGAFIPADVASVVAPILERAMARERSIGVRIHPDVVETIERLTLLGDHYRNRRKSDENRGDAAPFVEVSLGMGEGSSPSWITAADAAALAHRTPQAVTGRCRRGSLHAEQDGRTWRVCQESVTALLEGKTCRH